MYLEVVHYKDVNLSGLNSSCYVNHFKHSREDDCNLGGEIEIKLDFIHTMLFTVHIFTKQLYRSPDRDFDP